MRWLSSIAAAAALVAAVGACGSQISVPDQGVVVTGCQAPGACYLATCACIRASLGDCQTTARVCSTPGDPTTCNCPSSITVDDAGTMTTSQCLEPAQACVGRGPLCPQGGRCLAAGSSCASSGGDPPMLVTPVADGGVPTPRSSCQFVDDVCCPPSLSDGGGNSD